MAKSRTVKLLTKTTFIYLIFTFTTFLIVAWFLLGESNEFIRKELDMRYYMFEHRIENFIEKGKPLDRLPPLTVVTELSEKPDTSKFPIISDTMIYDATRDKEMMFRKKTTIINVQEKYYKLELPVPIDDYIRLKDDIFETLIPAFIILAVIIALFNFFISGYLFRPFNKILETMKTFKVGWTSELTRINTTTKEFKRMQETFHQMLERIEEDYQHLKEYTENMAHEIQTPLSIIRSKTENLISDESVMKKYSDTVKSIYDQTNHLSKLGHTLNLLTKIENREFTNTKNIKTKELIENHITAVSELVELKEMEINATLSESHTLLIDPYLFDIVVKNLVRNAITYGSNKEPIEIKTTEKTFEISNYGEILNFSADKLFERFYHTDHEKGAIGLGLAIVKKICELNNLKISYAYSEGKHIFKIK
ncbi:MAG: HAMP domain-containing histidine kinase [Ignavibacteriales bacterium]|nr:HAMP domain-containing histidine kinase [Ignavibacteriales bacterium]